ncbi:MAG: NAD-dependent epimerase/dehydratase family protein [Planctomycetes bacterium]|nr:NAD-dependent epimerase/dehydratase family protein [Planctomycetota bacterium]
MRAFITGATGFIGRRLVDRLLSDQHNVTALFRKDARHLRSVVGKVRGTLDNDVSTLARLMRGHDVLFHLAAMNSNDPAHLGTLLCINGEATRKLLAAAREALVPRFVLVSTAATLGVSTTGQLPLDESATASDEFVRRNPFIRSKLLAEAHAREAACAGQTVVTVNLGTVYGSHDPSSYPGSLVRQVGRSRVLLLPSGGDNVIDVDDVVDGIILAALRGRTGTRYILGGENLPYREIVNRIAGVVGQRPAIVELPALARGAVAMLGRLARTIDGSLAEAAFAGHSPGFRYYTSRRADVELGWRTRRDFTASLADLPQTDGAATESARQSA